jgi:hypothetical protein
MKGVSTGWERALAIRGVGYKAEVKGKQLHLALGYSHPVVFDLPEGVTAEVAKTPRTEDQLPTIDVTLRAADRQLLGETAVRIRACAPLSRTRARASSFTTRRCVARKARRVRRKPIPHPLADVLIAGGRKGTTPWLRPRTRFTPQPQSAHPQEGQRVPPSGRASRSTSRSSVIVARADHRRLHGPHAGRGLVALEGAQGQAGTKATRRPLRSRSELLVAEKLQGREDREGGLRPQRLSLPRPHRIAIADGAREGWSAVLSETTTMSTTPINPNDLDLHDRVVSINARRQGREGRSPLQLLGARRRRRRQRPRGRRPGQGERSARGHSQGRREREEEPVQACR